MTVLGAILSLYEVAVGSGSGLKDLRDFLQEKVGVEAVLASLVREGFMQHLPRLEHLCPTGRPSFDEASFREWLTAQPVSLEKPDDLAQALMPALRACVSTPGATCGGSEFDPIYSSILRSAVRGLWSRLAKAPSAAHEALLRQGREAAEAIAGIASTQAVARDEVQTIGRKLDQVLAQFAEFSQRACKSYYDELLDTAPPSEHKIDDTTYRNAFLLVRAEDFNHNFAKLARLFQRSVEWESLQSRSDNVFLEGGRGTGKSMLLRRLTAQAVMAARRLDQPSATFDNLPEGYFGVYVKLTRGYYEQFLGVDTIPSSVAALLAQHELNIEVADGFAEALRWLLKERCLACPEGHVSLLLDDLNRLFPKASPARSLDEFQSTLLKYEQDEVHGFYREKAFGNPVTYSGSAEQTVTFLRNLSKVLRNRLFPDREIRLFLLIDEFETLLPIQQMAINTAIKMRLPDLTLKIAVRKFGRKTSETFTPGDPIQDPRDYTEIRLDYSVDSREYAELLKGISEKRLQDADYPVTRIEDFLPARIQTEEVGAQELEAELGAMWKEGSRRSQGTNASFRNHAAVAATYRILARKKSRKSFSGFDNYVLLSSGVVSNFIELCKYAFFFALTDQLPLRKNPAIPTYLQTNAAYAVSERLFNTIDGNVPEFGGILQSMVSDLGYILRSRLLKHPSEPEANRFELTDSGNLNCPENKEVRMVLESAVVWSVFHLESVERAFLPRNTSRPPQAQLVINRIYAPVLGFSPRARWRVSISVDDLRQLLSPDYRIAAFRRLMRTIGNDQTDPNQLSLPLPPNA